MPSARMAHKHGFHRKTFHIQDMTPAGCSRKLLEKPERALSRGHGLFNPDRSPVQVGF